MFNDLFNQRIKDISFNWDKILNFDGETGPYVQYTYCRCASILRSIPEFDPDSWNGISGGTNVSYYETIPHDIVLELHKDNNQARFKAVRKDNGEELVGCPVPTSDPASLIIDEKNMVVKGQFDELWKLEIV